MQADFLNAKVGEAQQTLKDALIIVDATSKDQSNTIKKLEKSVEELTVAKAELSAAKVVITKEIA